MELEIISFDYAIKDILRDKANFDIMGKILFNTCKAVVEQITTGGKYDVKKVYSINISWYGLDAEDEYVFAANLTEFKGIHFDEVIPFSQKLDPKSNAPKGIHPEYFLILPPNFMTDDERKKKSSLRSRQESAGKRIKMLLGVQY